MKPPDPRRLHRLRPHRWTDTACNKLVRRLPINKLSRDKDNNSPAGVFIAVKETFAFSGSEELFAKLGEVNKFRNNYIAHGDNDLSDKHETERQLHLWVATLLLLKPPARPDF